MINSTYLNKLKNLTSTSSFKYFAFLANISPKKSLVKDNSGSPLLPPDYQSSIQHSINEDIATLLDNLQFDVDLIKQENQTLKGIVANQNKQIKGLEMK